MTNTPFELVGKKAMEGGVELLFRCIACGGQVTLPVRDEDGLEGKQLVSCPCGAQVNMFFGSPRMGRLLIKALQEEGEGRPHRCGSPLLN